jgi:hypothetical protein
MIGTTAFLIGTGISAAGAVGGAAMASSGAKSASKTMAQATDRATELQREMYYNNIDLQKPWYQAGTAGLDQLMALSGFESYTPEDPYAAQRSGIQTTNDAIRRKAVEAKAAGGLSGIVKGGVLNALAKGFDIKLGTLPEAPGQSWQPAGDGASTAAEILKMDPSYQFRFAEGQRALDRSAAARGGALSGGAIKASARFGQNLASTEYSNVWNRLATIAGIGKSTADTIGNYGMNYATQAGDMMTQGANARASGYVGSSNAWGGTLAGIGNNLANIYMMNQMKGMGGNLPVTP